MTGSLKHTALGRIIRLVEEAQASKAPIQCVADQVVPWFVAATLGLASLTFLWWMHSSLEVALLAATSVLIITCPCAFGLATPMSIAVASGLGAKFGILVKNGEVLETLSAINQVVFDKTGTLTEGRLSVVAIHLEDIDWQVSQGQTATPEIKTLLAKVAAVERYSEHPTAQAVLAWTEAQGISGAPSSVSQFGYQPGLGVAGMLEGQQILVGNSAWLDARQASRNPGFEAIAERLDAAGIGSIRVALAGHEVALLAIEDRIRPEAQKMISELKAEGWSSPC